MTRPTRTFGLTIVALLTYLAPAAAAAPLVLCARAMVTGDWKLPVDLLPDLVANYQAWEKTHLDPNGLFWQIDDRDGMEVSIGGSGYRATINSYQYGDALAIARIADLSGKKELAGKYRQKAARIKRLVEEKLWDAKAEFFKVSPRGTTMRLTDVRELHGLTPWYFNLPDPQYAVAWKQIMDPQGFFAPFGPTTAEQRHPRFMFEHRHECLWNGPSWPYATSVTLTALANLLHGDPQPYVTKKDYLELLRIYSRSHALRLPDGTTVPWIDEDLDPDTGQWIARSILEKRGVKDRGKDYNHSTFCDLVISGLVGMRPRADETVEVHPLVPDGTWDYFALDQVRYHGHDLTVPYDKTGGRYGRGKGLRVCADGRQIAAADGLQRVTAPLPAKARAERPRGDTAAGWVKSKDNPVLGGGLGTCFDVSLLHEGGKFRMWFSWRPKKSLALVESTDGIHYATSPDGLSWTKHPDNPIFRPDASLAWEKHKVTACQVIRHGGWHLMFYIGFRDEQHAQIGLARSRDGITGWQRHPFNPIIGPTHGQWDHDACYKPFAVLDRGRWLLWYNGRHGSVEQIGLAVHEGEDLGF